MAPPRPETPKGDLTQRVLGMIGQTSSKPHPKDAVFVCVDCEAFEHDQSKVTEVGVAVLDTRDLAGVDPGENGQQWITKMSYAHYRPVEYARKVNRRFVQGAEDHFAFGDSTWINLRDASNILIRIFQCPEKLQDVANFSRNLTDSRRNIVFVAHGASNDDEYMGKLGFQLKQAPNVVQHVDSQKVAGASKKKNIGLRRLLEALGMSHQGLHNAGNDAAYTLQAVVVMAVTGHQPASLQVSKDAWPIILPGVLRAPAVGAPHVYGGSAVEQGVALPTDGGKLRKRSPVGMKRAHVALPKKTTTPLDAIGDSQSRKRPAAGDVSSESDRPRKKPTR